VFLLYTAY